MDRHSAIPRTAAVIGGGTMGQGIAIALRLAGMPVAVVDADPAASDRARAETVRRVEAQVEAGLRPDAARDEIAALRAAGTVADAVTAADLICEAIPEDRALKLAVLAEVERCAPPDAVIATNTSSYPIDELARALTRPHRFLGLHWFNPAEWVPGVEVVIGSATDPAVVTRCSEALSDAGKRPAVVASSPGFIANRLQMALFAEAVACVEEGLATPEAVDEVVRSTFGFRLPHYGPFQIADMAGLDVYAAVFETLRAGLGERFQPPRPLRDHVAHGRLGVKAGAGFSDYPDATTARLLGQRDERYAATAQLLHDLTHPTATDGAEDNGEADGDQP